MKKSFSIDNDLHKTLVEDVDSVLANYENQEQELVNGIESLKKELLNYRASLERIRESKKAYNLLLEELTK